MRALPARLALSLLCTAALGGDTAQTPQPAAAGAAQGPVLQTETTAPVPIPGLRLTEPGGQEAPPQAAAQAFLGVGTVPLPPAVQAQIDVRHGTGLLIGQIWPDSPAAKAGLAVHDILLKFDDQILLTQAQFSTLVQHARPGGVVQVTILRHGQEKTVPVTLCCAPEGLPAAAPPDDINAQRKAVHQALEDNPAAVSAAYHLLFQSGAARPRQAAAEWSFSCRTRSGHQVDLKAAGVSRLLRISDAAGALLYEGDLAKREDRARIPADLAAIVRNLPGVE